MMAVQTSFATPVLHTTDDGSEYWQSPPGQTDELVDALGRIFAPLGMEDTFFAVPEAKIPRLASCYVKTPEEDLRLLDRGAETA